MASGALLHEKLTESIIGGFFEVYNYHGYGFNEKAYANSMELELKRRGHQVEREVPFVIPYLGVPVGLYKCDMVIDGLVVVEIKAGELLPASSKRQLFNYLRVSRKSVGLLLHFGPEPKFYRQINTPESTDQPPTNAVPQ